MNPSSVTIDNNLNIIKSDNSIIPYGENIGSILDSRAVSYIKRIFNLANKTHSMNATIKDTTHAKIFTFPISNNDNTYLDLKISDITDYVNEINGILEIGSIATFKCEIDSGKILSFKDPANMLGSDGVLLSSMDDIVSLIPEDEQLMTRKLLKNNKGHQFSIIANLNNGNHILMKCRTNGNILTSVCLDITENYITEKMVHESKINYEKIKIEMDQLANIISHDLREPLSGINGYSTLFLRKYNKEDKDEYIVDKKGMYFISEVSKSCSTMLTRLDDLLKWSKSTSENGLDQEFNIDDAIDEAKRNLNGKFLKNINKFTVFKMPRVIGSEGMIVQVFQNLIGNAIKYRKKNEGLNIEIGCEEKNRVCTIYVKDNGIGFDPKYKNKIFGVFQRLHKEEYEGTGIGLAIVKKIIEKHGGEISVESEPGVGSTFRFTVKKAP